MLFITLILLAGSVEGGNYPLAVVMLILLGIQAGVYSRMEQNEFSKAALRGFTKYMMMRKTEMEEKKQTNKERAEKWLDELIEKTKQLNEVGNFFEEDSTEPLALRIASSTILIRNASAVANIIGVPVNTRLDKQVKEIFFYYNGTRFLDYEIIREQASS